MKSPRAFLRPGDVVLDIGAHDGDTAKSYAEVVGPTGYVLAVEPHPVSYAALAAYCEGQSIVTCLHVAVGPKVGQDTLYSDERDAQRSSLWAANTIDAGPSYPVTVTTVDVLVRSMPRQPRLIKVDAQGAEVGILQGARDTLRLPIAWYVEVWADGLKTAGTSVADLCWLFTRAGFQPADRTAAAWQAEAEQHHGHSAVDILWLPPRHPRGAA